MAIAENAYLHFVCFGASSMTVGYCCLYGVQCPYPDCGKAVCFKLGTLCFGIPLNCLQLLFIIFGVIFSPLWNIMCEIIMGVELNEFDIATSSLSEGGRWNVISAV